MRRHSGPRSFSSKKASRYSMTSSARASTGTVTVLNRLDGGPLKRIDKSDASLGNMPNIAGCKGEAVLHRRGHELAVLHGHPRMKRHDPPPLVGAVLIEREKARPVMQHERRQPCFETGSILGARRPLLLDALPDLSEGNDAQEQIGRRNRAEPGDHLRVRPCLCELRDDIGVEKKAQSSMRLGRRREGLISRPTRGIDIRKSLKPWAGSAPTKSR